MNDAQTKEAIIARYGEERYDRHRIQIREINRAHQQESLKTATSHGQPWTLYELQVVLDEDFTTFECTQLIGRTFAAVKNMRQRLRKDEQFRLDVTLEVGLAEAEERAA